MMRKIPLGVCSLLAFAVSVFVAAQSGAEPAKVRLRLVDAATGKDRPGIFRALGPDKKPIELSELLDRLMGIKKETQGIFWYVVPAGGATVTLPRMALELEALSGLE